MAEDIEIPKVGKLPKKVIIPLAVGLAGFVAWRFWAARNETSDGDSTITDGEFGAVDSSIPGVVGAVSPTNSYGSGDSGNGDDAGNDPTRFTTNAGWSNYVRSQLQGSYEDAAIVAALGNYLGSQPLSTEQQTIVRAAIAVGGYPPVGSFSIISGGNTAITVAPGNVHVQSVSERSAVIAFNAVPGAARYNIYRSGVSANVGTSNTSPITLSGLDSNRSYTVQVAAVSASGAVGPKSTGITVKTKAYVLARPATPTVSSITKSSVKVSVKAVPGADGYRWYINGGTRGYSESPTNYSIGGLAANKKYTVTVAADRTGQNPGPQSPGRSFTTKKK